MEEHEDLLMELVTTRYWQAIRREVERTQEGLVAALCQPVTSLEALVAKEGNASRLAALRQFVSNIEETADRRAKQLRTSSH